MVDVLCNNILLQWFHILKDVNQAVIMISYSKEEFIIPIRHTLIDVEYVLRLTKYTVL
jgi:hypothetical protein